jgi:hypothetical protein
MNSVPGPTVHESPRQIIGVAFIWFAIFCFYETLTKNLALDSQILACAMIFIIGFLLIDH